MYMYMQMHMYMYMYMYTYTAMYTYVQSAVCLADFYEDLLMCIVFVCVCVF